MAKKILIIEDDEFFRELIRKKISSNKDFEFMEAADGEKGLEAIKKEKPDLVLLDLLLPNVDGFEVLSKVRSDSDISKTPIIVLSNLGQQEDIEKALKLGANDYMIKSQFDINQIIDKITNLM